MRESVEKLRKWLVSVGYSGLAVKSVRWGWILRCFLGSDEIPRGADPPDGCVSCGKKISLDMLEVEMFPDFLWPGMV